MRILLFVVELIYLDVIYQRCVSVEDGLNEKVVLYWFVIMFISMCHLMVSFYRSFGGIFSQFVSLTF